MGKFYPELISQDANIVSIVLNEEEKFLLTIDRGFDQLKEAMLSSSKTKVLSGKDVFKLYDTFGFPVDLIQDIASETDYVLDMKAYEEEMLNQRNSSKKASKFKNPVGDSIDLVKTMNLDSSTRFVGYQNLDSESKVFAIIKDNEIVPSAGGKEKIGVILESTSFYAESGGQVGDKGFIKTSKCLIDIFDTQKTKEGFFIHSGIVREGEIKNGDKVEVSVDGAHRLKIAQHHTATHILHSALREILGDHVRQAGSLVKSDRLRFDFSHFSNIKLSTLKQIENLSNERIRLNNDVIVDENVDYNKAIKSGATAFFEDKYGDSVRVVRIGDFSMELCGGTHIKSSGEIGSLCISSESSISSGIRRIEAHVGESGMAYMNKIKDSLIASSGILNSSIDKVQDGILRIQKENDSLKSKLSGYERKATQNLAEEVLSNCEVVNDIRIVSYLATNMSSPQLKSLWDDLKKIKETIGLLGSNNKDGSILICATSSDVENFNCKDFLNLIAPKFNGKGGGKSNLAQLGCDYIDSLEEGLSLIKSQL
jgi:alanyl-tRNA synthetase